MHQVQPHLGVDVPATFEHWIGNRRLPVLGTNAGADVLAFQNWRPFKEAFAPELIARAVTESDRPVRRCLDPFGGSGTSALACQFLGVHPLTVEVNPYLADLIEAKLSNYAGSELAKDLGRVVSSALEMKSAEYREIPGPATLLEPGVNGRWIFNRNVADGIFRLRAAIERLDDERSRRLFSVILGGQLVPLSNVRISGKGRRYRGGWQARPVEADRVIQTFVDAVGAAVHDISLHKDRPTKTYELLRGDARQAVRSLQDIDLAVFSPPYPNSFDYTDVYNLELWMLGYLRGGSDNADLRRSTLSSHVQLSRAYAQPPTGSITLSRTLAALDEKKSQLWHKDIPAMVGAYFADLNGILSSLRRALNERGRVYMVVGDSQYAGVIVPVADILSELAEESGYSVLDTEASRSMRSSAQQGGDRVLPETLLVLG